MKLISNLFFCSLTLTTASKKLMMKSVCLFVIVLQCLVSNVFSQDIAVAYRNGSLWGYADTLGNVIIEPVYDEVIKGWTPVTALLVAKNKKWGVVSKKGKIVVPLKHDYISPIRDGFFFTEDKAVNNTYLHGLYTSAGKLVIEPEDQEINFITERLIIVRTSPQLKKGGVGLFDPKNKKVNWIIPRANRHVYLVQRDSLIITESDTKRTEYKVNGNALKKVKETSIDPAEEEIVEMAPAEQTLYGGPVQEITLSLTIRDTASGTGKKHFSLVKKTKINHQERQESVLTECQGIMIIRYPNGSKERFSKEQKRWITDHWAIAQKNGKYGAFFSVPEGTLIPFEYDSIAPEMLPYKCETVLIKARQNGKWGLINRNNNIVSAFAFDDIIFSGKDFYAPTHKSCFRFLHGLIVKQGERYNVLSDSVTLVSAGGFDRAINSERPGQGIHVFQAAKKGFYYSGHLFVPSYEGDGTFGGVHTSRYPLAEIIDKQKGFLGYVDRKGVIFFRE
jgi:hypothetical protein